MPNDFGSLPARAQARETEADFLALDVGVLRRLGVFDEARAGELRTVEWTRKLDGRHVASIGVICGSDAIELEYTYDKADQATLERVAVEWTRCNYGGLRPWFRCPHCGRRAGKLYGDARFLCRRCQGFAYESTRLDRSTRLLYKAQDIRVSLGGSASVMDLFPPRPRHMRRSTYERLRAEAERCERESWLAMAAWLR